MKNELDGKLILSAYEKIIQHGEDHEDGKLYEGICAFSDIDGYTVYLCLLYTSPEPTRPY